jgi:hypothetical protein
LLPLGPNDKSYGLKVGVKQKGFGGVVFLAVSGWLLANFTPNPKGSLAKRIYLKG